MTRPGLCRARKPENALWSGRVLGCFLTISSRLKKGCLEEIFPDACRRLAFLLGSVTVLTLPFGAGTLNQYSITYDFQLLINVCLYWMAEWSFVLWEVITKSIIFGSFKDIYLIIYYVHGLYFVRPPGTHRERLLNRLKQDQIFPCSL
jgi:hypothetical protein